MLDLGRHLASHTTQNLFLIVGVDVDHDGFAYDDDDFSEDDGDGDDDVDGDDHHENTLAAELPSCLPCSGTLVMLVRTQIQP